jgi:hypothetical protein
MLGAPQLGFGGHVGGVVAAGMLLPELCGLFLYPGSCGGVPCGGLSAVATWNLRVISEGDHWSGGCRGGTSLRHGGVSGLQCSRGLSLVRADVVDAVVEVATGAPLQGIRNVAGPDVFPLDELGRVLYTQTANVRSMRLAAKLGFTEVERFEAYGAEQWFGTWSPVTSHR